MYPKYIPFSLVINLVGSSKNVNISSYEIRDYLFDSYLGYKVIENKDIDNHFNRKFIAQDIIINQCNFLSNQQLKKLHYNIENNYNYSSKKLVSCALLVRSKEYDNYIKFLYKCPEINNIYNIEDKFKTKHNVLFNIIFNNYFNR
jgi:flagellin-specific chaperone FliS